MAQNFDNRSRGKGRNNGYGSKGGAKNGGAYGKQSGRSSFTVENNREEPKNRSALPELEESDEFGLIVGRNPVIEALKSGRNIDTLYVNSEAGGSIGMITKMARDKGIVVKSVSDAKLTLMCRGASHQGVIASGACAEYVSVEDILEVSAKKGSKPFIIICDEIEDPHNLGAIIRTAEAAGADGIIIPKRRSASLNATVYKTSAGAASWLPVARVPNLGAAIDELKKNGIWIYGTDASGSDYTETAFTDGIALVIGSEGFGMGRLIKEKCDFLVKLPMNGRITSLNASVAAGIFMYEAVRQRRG
ncbi:MAG: 23S rRNA (guanosine(2251)-2'-O)-methyltransferase RlmB [Huintestinicola sp.]